MIQEIKLIVKNFLENAMLCNIMYGTVTTEGIKVNDKLTIPNELMIGNLKNKVVVGDEVWLLRNHGGQKYYILEVVE